MARRLRRLPLRQRQRRQRQLLLSRRVPPGAEGDKTPVPLLSAAQAEMMAADNGEAFNDGGSESRSSEPCYLYEFEAGRRAAWPI